MAEPFVVCQSELRADRYENLLPQIEAIVESETNLIAVLANTAAAIRQTFGFFWIGFYLKLDEHQLVLGPFQGDLACSRIPFGKGVCGTAWQRGQTIVVEDVEQFEGHIACSSLSKSEIVVPVVAEGKFKAVLDIDSTAQGDFGETDKIYLEKLSKIIAKRF